MDASRCQHVLRELLDHQAATDAKLKNTESVLLKLGELRATTLAHRATSESQLVKLTGLIDLVSTAVQEFRTDEELPVGSGYSRNSPLEGEGRFYLVVHPLGAKGDSFRVRTIGEGKEAWAKFHDVPMPRHNC